MTLPISIPARGIVLVCDGGRALILRNRGDAPFPNLQTEDVLVAEPNPSDHDQGSDRPGRVAMGSFRSAVETTSFHQAGEAAFARSILNRLEILGRAEPFKDLIVVAPPRMLAALRDHMQPPIKGTLRREIDKDLTKLPVFEIEQHLAGTPRLL